MDNLKKVKPKRAVKIISSGGGGANQAYTANAASRLVNEMSPAKAAGGHQRKKR